MVKLVKQKSAMRITIDRKSHTIKVTQTIDASILQVFAAWTQPDQLANWWDPCGKPLAVCEINLTKGGSFKFVNKGRPDMPFSGRYVEIAPPDRIVFESELGTGRVLLNESKGMTTMTVEIECASDEELNQLLEHGVDKDTSTTLENLRRYLKNGAILKNR